MLLSSPLLKCLLTLYVLFSLTSPVGANDECSNAVVVDSFPFSVIGNTTDATIDFPTPTDTLNNLTCGITPQGRGIWYKIDGNHQFLQATVTDRDDLRFNSALFQGSSCSSQDLACLPLFDYSLTNQRIEPTSRWFAENGTTYYLFVTGISAEDVGAFDLKIEDITQDRPVNDRCETAILLDSLPAQVNGSTFGAWPGVDINDCSVDNSARGLYYSFVPKKTGTYILQVNQFVPDPTVAQPLLELAVLQDGCSRCLTHKDFLDPASQQELKMDLEEGITYTMLISGQRFDDVGTFQFEFKEGATSAGGSTKGSAAGEALRAKFTSILMAVMGMVLYM